MRTLQNLHKCSMPQLPFSFVIISIFTFWKIQILSLPNHTYLYHLHLYFLENTKSQISRLPGAYSDVVPRHDEARSNKQHCHSHYRTQEQAHVFKVGIVLKKLSKHRGICQVHKYNLEKYSLENTIWKNIVWKILPQQTTSQLDV